MIGCWESQLLTQCWALAAAQPPLSVRIFAQQLLAKNCPDCCCIGMSSVDFNPKPQNPVFVLIPHLHRSPERNPHRSTQEKPVHPQLLGVSLRFLGFTERARGVSDIHLQLASPGEILARSIFGEP